MNKNKNKDFSTLIFIVGFTWATIFREFNVFIRIVSLIVGSTLITWLSSLKNKRKKKDVLMSNLEEVKEK